MNQFYGVLELKSEDHLLMQHFDLGCSPIVFDFDDYMTLTRSGHRLQALLEGATQPLNFREEYFIRCIREDVDYDSHQCTEADAWRQMIERREFERDHPAPAVNRTWVRIAELQPGMIVLPEPSNPMLIVRRLEVQYRGTPAQEYRLAPQFSWRKVGDGFCHLCLNLTTGAFEELPIPSVMSRVVRKRSPTTIEELMRPWSSAAPSWLEFIAAVNEPCRELLYVWQNSPDDEMLILDCESATSYFMPPHQVSHFSSVQLRQLHPYSPLRVQYWDGIPVWVWGLA